jgi:AraC-like DNA-binding protein/quercetin dioxygenase-like cupin family protein
MTFQWILSHVFGLYHKLCLTLIFYKLLLCSYGDIIKMSILSSNIVHSLNAWTSKSFPVWCFIEKQKSARPHSHNYTEIVFIIEGTGKHLTPYGEVEIAPGNIYIIPAFGMHGYTETHNLKLINLMLIPEQLPLPLLDLYGHQEFKRIFLVDLEYYNRLQEYPHIHLDEDQFQEIIDYLMQIINTEKSKSLGKNCCIIGFLLIIFSKLCDYCNNFHSEMPVLANINSVIEYINLNYHQNIGLKRLANIAGMSKNSLINHFIKVIGYTPMKYVINCRLACAAKLLINTELPIYEIAERSGFSDSAYFSRIFKKSLGLSPSSYRESMRDKTNSPSQSLPNSPLALFMRS